MAATEQNRPDTVNPDEMNVLLGKTSRSQVVVEFMKNQILSGRWKDGEKVEDGLIATELGVSRNSVREAFGQLTLHRILEKHQWRGYYIPWLSIQDVEEVITVRKNLEMLALELFLQREQPAALDEIADSIRQSEEDFRRNDVGAFHRSDYVIHEIIHRNCGNSWIPMLVSLTKFHIDALRRMDKNTNFQQVSADSIAGHWRMLDAMRRGDQVEALREMEAQIDRHRKRLVDAFHHDDSPENRGKEAPMR